MKHTYVVLIALMATASMQAMEIPEIEERFEAYLKNGYQGQESDVTDKELKKIEVLIDLFNKERERRQGFPNWLLITENWGALTELKEKNDTCLQLLDKKSDLTDKEIRLFIDTFDDNDGLFRLYSVVCKGVSEVLAEIAKYNDNRNDFTQHIYQASQDLRDTFRLFFAEVGNNLENNSARLRINSDEFIARVKQGGLCPYVIKDRNEQNIDCFRVKFVQSVAAQQILKKRMSQNIPGDDHSKLMRYFNYFAAWVHGSAQQLDVMRESGEENYLPANYLPAIKFSSNVRLNYKEFQAKLYAETVGQVRLIDGKFSPEQQNMWEMYNKTSMLESLKEGFMKVDSDSDAGSDSGDVNVDTRDIVLDLGRLNPVSMAKIRAQLYKGFVDPYGVRFDTGVKGWVYVRKAGDATSRELPIASFIDALKAKINSDPSLTADQRSMLLNGLVGKND